MSKTSLATQVAITDEQYIINLLNIIANGSGEEFFNVKELKAIGAHPFSDSTRRRKIKSNEYPAPIKISDHMKRWKAGDIKVWRQDPKGYKSKGGK